MMQTTIATALARAEAGNERPDLSLDQITESTIALIRREGLGRLSMRQLAAELGVTPMAVYYHVPSKTALLDLAADRIMKSIALPDPALHWTERLRQLILDLQQLFAEYPGLARYAAEHMDSAATLSWMEMILHVLHTGGFPPKDAVSALVVIGFYNNPASLRMDRPGSLGLWDIVPQHAIGRRIRKAPQDYPNLAKALPHLRGADETDFRIGLDRLIAGLEADLRASLTDGT
jgi:AcrR family transcriptional regulator